MRVGIEAQRIFRKNKHGMDYVVLQEILEIQKMDTENEYYVYVYSRPFGLRYDKLVGFGKVNAN